ncbi:MAG: nucleotidyltransferase domain-containing protein [Nitrospirota bacterium]|nr:nucleotidyltransferase domain-containing protein [Nitrospirota bacterium]
MQRKYSSSVQVFYPRFDRETIIKILKEKVKVLKKELPVSMVVLFGSYAKNNYTIKSDVDLLVVYKGELKGAYEKVKKAVDIYGIEPHVYSKEEYAAMKDTIERMVEDGVVIFEE